MIPRDILELLTRFELVTRFTPKSFQLLGGPTPSTWGCAPSPRRTCGDGRGQEKQKKSVSISTHRFLELLTRFELVTSSLPRTRSTD